MRDLNNYIRVIPDFPKPGTLFRDVTGILESPDGFQLALDKSSVASARETDFSRATTSPRS